jgi:hypothetical protein
MLSFTPAANVPDQPCITLLRWRIYEVLGRDFFLAGHALETGRVRVSTALATLDVRKLRAASSSGRVYVMDGSPDAGSTAAYVWHWWSISTALGQWRDATEELWAEHQRLSAMH